MTFYSTNWYKFSFIGYFLLSFLWSLTAQNSTQQLIAEDKDPTAFQFFNDQLKSNDLNARNAFHYENLSLNTILTKDELNYKASKIERDHYIDNPFDIDDFSNPFNLPRPGSRKRLMSNQQSNQQKTSNFVKDLFSQKENTEVIIDPSKVEVKTPSWLFFLFLGLLAFFAYLLTIYRDEVKKSFGSFFSLSSASQQLREQENPFSPYSVAVFILFALGAAALALITINKMTVSQTNPANWKLAFYLLLAVSVAFTYFLKYGQLSLIGFVFPIKQELQYYNLMLNNSNRIVAITVVPLLFLLSYTPENMQNFFLYASLFLVVSLYLFAAIRTILVARETILFHKFHFFIYLCSVEIAPVLILMKLISII